MNDYLNKVAKIESDNNPLAKSNTSSATGAYQMTRGTFNDLQKSKPWLMHSTWEQHATNPDIQRAFAEELTQRNANDLAKRGHAVNDLNQYLAHFAGVGGADKLLRANPDATVAQILGEQVAKANPTLANKSVKQVKDLFGKKLGISKMPWEMAWQKTAQMAEGGEVMPWEKSWSSPVKEENKKEETKNLDVGNVGYLEGLVRSGLHGATMGWSDELIGKGRAYAAPLREWIHGKPQIHDANKQIAIERAKQEKFSRENPVASTVAEVGGGLATTFIPGGAIVKGVGAGAKVIPGVTKVANVASKAPQWAKTGARLSGTGAVMGGIAGAGTADTDLSQNASFSDNLQKRLEGAGTGATIGAIAGPALGLLGAGAVKGGQKVSNLFSRAPELEKAERKVIERLGKDEINTQAIRDKAREAVDLDLDRRLFDVGNTNTEALAQTLVSKGGTGAKELVDTMENRILNAKENIANKINTQISEGKHYYATKASLDEARKTIAKPLYEEAYASPPVKNEIINGMLQMEPFKQAYARAQVLAQREAGAIQAEYLQKIGRASSPEEKRLLTMQMEREVQAMRLPDLTPENLSAGIPVKSLDMVKRGIDDIQSSGYRPNATTVEMDDAKAISGLKNIFLEEVDRAVPKYAEARKIAKGAIESTEAIKMGNESFMKVRNADELKAMFNKLDDHDKEYFRVGAKEALLNSFMNTSQNRNVATLVNNPTTKAKLSVMFDNPKDAEKFIKGLEEEAKQVVRANKTVRGSPTQPRLASEQDWDGGSFINNLGNFVGDTANVALNPFNPMNWIRLGGRGVGMLKDKVSPISERQVDEASRLLNTPLTTGEGVNRQINPALDATLKRLEERKKRILQQQQQQQKFLTPRYTGVLGGAGVVTQNEPKGYLPYASGGYTGPLSNQGTLSSMGMSPLAMLHRAMGGLT